jgi:hypothetical protein
MSGLLFSFGFVYTLQLILWLIVLALPEEDRFCSKKEALIKLIPLVWPVMSLFKSVIPFFGFLKGAISNFRRLP